MSLISQASILRASDKAGKYSPDSTSWTELTSSITHLHLEARAIRTISNLDSCYAVRVLYLYNNRIDAIRGLENLRQLTHLYLQKNQIRKLEGLDNLVSLQKLYLEDNEISFVENLERCTNLQELHLSRQRLSPGAVLTFNPDCLEALARTLGRLAVQHCNISDVSPLAVLQRLHNLNLAGNQLEEVGRIQGLVGSLPQLQILDVRGNPLCRARSYRKDIVGVAQSLQHLDGTPVLKQERLFLQRLHSRKLSRDVCVKTVPDSNVQRARGMLDTMPNTSNSSGNRKSAGSKATAYAVHEDQPDPTGNNDIAHPLQDDASHAANARNTGSASSSDGNPEAAFALLQQIAPDMPPDQHALNDLSELHTRAASSATGLPVVDVQNMQPAVRQMPSRGSSFASSRGGSAVRRTASNVAPEAESPQLELQGLAII